MNHWEPQRLWRTPTRDVSGRAMEGDQRLAAGFTLNLIDQAKTPKLWPTPDAKLANSGADYARANRNGSGGDDLTTRLHKLWPTPRKEGYDSQGKGHGDLVYEVKNRLLPTPRNDHSGLESHGVTALGGSLNPRFVEELMGFPIDHTALKPSATPSSRSKPTRSSKRSPKP
jgi:hypothetical protein